MASQDSDQPKIEHPGQRLSSHGRDLPVCSVDDCLNPTLSDRDYFKRNFITHVSHPESLSGTEVLVQARPRSLEDLEDGLTSRSATEPLDQIVTESVSNSEHEEEEEEEEEEKEKEKEEKEEEGEETLEDWNSKLTNMIHQMMFVSGETSEASVETTTIIEEIVHTQVTEIVSFTMSPFRNKMMKL